MIILSLSLVKSLKNNYQYILFYNFFILFKNFEVKLPFKSKIDFGGGSSHRGATETNPTRNHEVVSLIPGLTQWVKDLALP